MNNSFNKLLEDSKGNKTYIFFKEDSLYGKIFKPGNQSAESVIINEVYNSFIVALNEDDSIFLACREKNGNIVLLSCSNNSWELKDTISISSQGNILLLELFIIKGIIHILYATDLPIKNYHNIYHMFYSNGTWKKDSIAEICSDNLYDSYSCLITADNTIHFIYISNDGKTYLIKYSYFNNAMRWLNSTISNLNSSNINLNLLNDGNNLYLICYSVEEKTFIYYYFIKDSTNCDSFGFEFITKFKFNDYKYQPLFYALDKSIHMGFISGDSYCEYMLNRDFKEWEPYFKIPLNNKIAQIQMAIYKNRLSSRGYYCYFDEFNRTIFPVNKVFNTANGSDDITKVQQDYYIPYLLDQIKQLSEEIKSLNERLDGINVNPSHVKQFNGEMKTGIKMKSIVDSSNKKYNTENIYQQNKNSTSNSNFKQTFMNSNSLLKKIDPKFAAKFADLSKNNFGSDARMASKMSSINASSISQFIKSTDIPIINKNNSVNSKINSIAQDKSKNKDEPLQSSDASSSTLNPAVEAKTDFTETKSIINNSESNSESADSSIENPSIENPCRADMPETEKYKGVGFMKKIGDLFK